jgi:lipopolysaccharide heptosyltransferase I
MIAAAPAPPDRVLIIKPSSLGDVVTALPVLRGLKRTFPQARAGWLLATTCAPLLEADDDLDEIILFDRQRLGRAWRSGGAAWALGGLLRTLRKKHFDWVIDLQGLLRSGLLAAATGAELRAGFADAREGAALFYTHRFGVEELHTVDRNIALARLLGIDARREDMRLKVAGAGQAFAEAFCRGHGLRGGDFLILVPPTRWATKLYPVRHWRTVAAALSRRAPVVLIGSPAEKPLCDAVARDGPPGVLNLAGATGVAEMVGLISRAAGVVGSDSAAKFIAPAVGVDALVLIGPTQVERTGPVLRGRALVADVPCQGCLKRRCSHVTCMQSIAPADVIAAAEEMLDGRRR